MSAWLKDLEVDEISFVDKGASGDDKHRPAVVLLKRKDGGTPAWSLSLDVKKLDEEKRLAGGWAMIAADETGKSIVDHQGDKISTEDLEKAAHRALKRATAGDMHEATGKGEIVESMVLTAEKRKAFGLSDGVQGWAVVMKITDDALWADIKAGKKLELSIGGRAARVAEKRAPWIDRVLAIFGKSLEQAAKEGDEPPQEESKSMDLASIMAKLTPEEQAILQQALGAAKSEEPKKEDGEEPAAKALAKLSPEEREALEKQRTENEDLKKRLAKLEEENEMRTFVAKADELSHLPGAKREDLAKTLRAASKTLSAAELKTLNDVLKSAAEAIRKSALLVEKGSVRAAEGSAYAEIQAIAKSLREKDPSLTEAQAIMKATDSNPELYKRYQEERK